MAHSAGRVYATRASCGVKRGAEVKNNGLRTEMGAVVLDGGAEVAEVLRDRLGLVRKHARRLEVHAVHVTAECLKKLMHDGTAGT